MLFNLFLVLLVINYLLFLFWFLKKQNKLYDLEIVDKNKKKHIKLSNSLMLKVYKKINLENKKKDIFFIIPSVTINELKNIIIEIKSETLLNKN